MFEQITLFLEQMVRSDSKKHHVVTYKKKFENQC